MDDVYKNVASSNSDSNGDSNGGNEARMSEINRIRNKLEKAVTCRKRIYSHYKRLYNTSHYISIGSGGLSTTLITTVAAQFGNPVVLLPLSITAATLGLISGIFTGLSKLFSKRFRKHDQIAIMANATLCNINELLSDSLRNYKISHKEFVMINNIYQEFLRNCKNTKDVYSKGNLVEKDELIRSINNIAKNEFK